MMCCIFFSFLLGIISDDISAKPTINGPHIEPCANPLDCLHGVLMHGDESAGDSHKTEDSYLKFKPVLDTGPKEKSGPQDAESTFHGALMHGGNDHETTHQEAKTDQPTKPAEEFGPKDTNKMMHDVMHGDSEASHDHKHENTNTDKAIQKEFMPPDAAKMMHDVLMHNDDKSENHHVHSRPEDETTKSKGPIDQSNLMHELMHNGEHVDHSSEQSSDQSGTPSGPNTDGLHGILMHGDTETGHDHEKDHQHSKNVPFKFNIEEIKKLGIDPEILKTILPVDKEDYKKWQEQQQSETSDDYYKSTYASISDSFLSDIELMKRRYLAQDPEQEAELNAYLDAKDSDLVASQIVDILENMEHEDDDLRHNLELIGSTEPINEIHQSHTDSQKKQEM